MRTLTPEEFEAQYGAGSTAAFAPVATPRPGFVEGVGQALDRRSSALGERMDAGQSPISNVLQTFGAGAGLGGDIAFEAVKAITPDPVEDAVGEAVGAAAQLPVVRDALQGYEGWKAKHPEAAANLESVVNVAGLVGGPKVAQKATGTAARGVGSAVTNTADQALAAGTGLKSRVQTAIARKNVHPQLEQSVTRLTEADPFFVKGTQRLTDPLTTFDEYFAQSQKALTDIKADPAISVVGSEIGDAFNTVIKQRRAVGEVMGEELKAVGKHKIGITEPKAQTFTELAESGLAYNSRTNQLTSFTGSRFAPPEVKMLEEYVKRLVSLGDTPTVSEIDNFIARSRSTLDFLKGEAGVVGTTNAERIIKNSISKLKERLNPAVNGDGALAPYWQANQTYAELSDFVEEGSAFLGKLTQDGDFAKDASLAKSAVQSVLNNGKKDWLVRLEALTGYPALDKSVLALQAMKDAGDFRGLSLLQQIAEGSIPTSKMGLINKILEIGIDKAGDVLLGEPVERTRAFLKSLGAPTPKQP